MTLVSPSLRSLSSFLDAAPPPINNNSHCHPTGVTPLHPGTLRAGKG